MPSRTGFQQLARLRLHEAEVLLDAGFHEGAVYLSGYAIECALKARVCTLLGVKDYPEGKLKPVYGVHDLSQLLLLAGLGSSLEVESARLRGNWRTVSTWHPEWRYNVGVLSTPGAIEFLDAVRDTQHGVLAWISKSW